MRDGDEVASTVVVMKRYRRLLMIYPEFAPTFWGMQYSLHILQRKSLMPSLGLLTIAAMTPREYEIRVVDLNCTKLTDEDIGWADMVLFSAMLAQKDALFKASRRCRSAGKFVVFGGPYPTACPDECRPECDVIVMNEGEITWPLFLKDLEAGDVKPVYQTDQRPDIKGSPCPRFDLINVLDYVVIPIQFSRGCPFDCEFCDITILFGHKPRTKSPAQILVELDAVYAAGHRGRVFIVDDNFIGNKKEVKALLPELRRWNQEHGNPFTFGTEASVDLADDPALLQGMVEAGFVTVFLGIESPSVESLKETHKFLNAKGSLVDRVRTIQQAGLIVYGGFIIGFDSDTEDIFDRQLAFIKEAAVADAMISPILALPGTALHARLKQEDRLLDHDRLQIYGYTNVLTRIPPRKLLQGYRRIVETIYNPTEYFGRALEALKRLPREKSFQGRLRYFRRVAKTETERSVDTSPDAKPEKVTLFGLIRFFWVFPSLFKKDFRRHIRSFVWRVLWTCPEQLPRTLGFIVMGYHSNRLTYEHLIPRLDEEIAKMPEDLTMPRPRTCEGRF